MGDMLFLEWVLNPTHIDKDTINTYSYLDTLIFEWFVRDLAYLFFHLVYYLISFLKCPLYFLPIFWMNNVLKHCEVLQRRDMKSHK